MKGSVAVRTTSLSSSPGVAPSRASKFTGSRTPFGMMDAPEKSASSVKTPSCPSGPRATCAATDAPGGTTLVPSFVVSAKT